MKYEVISIFRDRFNDMKLCNVGDLHEPPTGERATQLVRQGFIKQIDEPKKRSKKAADEE